MRTKRYSIVTGLVLILSLLAFSLLIPGSVNAATDKVKPTISGTTNSVAYLNHSFDPRKGVTAKDNVDGNITSIIKITGKVNTKKLGKYTLTYKVTDSAKNTCTVKRVITVIKDTTNPKITGASNKTIYMGYSFNPKTGVKATDNAAGNLTSKIKVSGKVNTKKVGKYKITYTVTDKAKNTSKVTRTITVKKDTTKPKITGASNKTIYKGYSFNTKTGVKATDNVDGNITSKIKISGKLNVNEVGIYKLKYTVEDKTKNKTTVTRTITVKKDTTKPKITGVSNVTINYGSSFDPRKGIKATDNLDGTITSSVKITGTVNTNKVGSYKLTYLVKDKTGNQTTITRTITVVDKVPPNITGVSDITINYESSFDPMKGIKATDYMDGTITNRVTITGTVDFNKVGTYKLTYTVKDKSGNQASVTRSVKVVDKISPKITGASNISIDYGTSFDPMKGVTATDYIDGAITNRVKITGTVDTDKIGAYQLTYTVKDKSGNQASVSRTVKVVDKVSPEITGASNTSIDYGTSFDPMKGVTATDYIDGTITNRVKITGTVNTAEIGIYTLTYTVKDNSGNQATVTRKVNVVDRVSPVLTGVEKTTTSIGKPFYLLSGVQARDEIDGDLTANIEVEGKVNVDKPDTYKLTYTVKDKSGNIATAERKVTVVDNIPPEINVIDDDIGLQWFDSFDPMEGVTATDNYDGDLTSKIQVEGEIDTSLAPAEASFIFTFTVTDEAGNTTKASRSVYLKPRIPVFKGLDEFKIYPGESFDPLEGVAVTDEATGEDITSFIKVNHNVDVNKIGSYEISYTLPEVKGYNTVTITRPLIVMDNIPPIINGVKDLTINQGDPTDLELLLTYDISVIDNVDKFYPHLVLELEHSIDTSKPGDYILTYKATDSAGNTTVESCTVTVKYIPVTSIKISTDFSSPSVKIGKTFPLYTSVWPREASNQNVTWTSSDESIATINQEGKVTAIKAGTVTFTATVDDGITDKLTIEVIDKDLRFDTHGYGTGGDLFEINFSLVNYDNEAVDVDAVKVFDKVGSLVQTFSSEQLKDMGIQTNILPSQNMYMQIAVENGPSIVAGGKVVVFARPSGGDICEYTLNYDFSLD